MSRPRILYFPATLSHYSSIKAGLLRQRVGSGQPWWLQLRTLQGKRPAAVGLQLGEAKAKKAPAVWLRGRRDEHNARNCAKKNSALAFQPTGGQFLTPSPSYHARSPASSTAPSTPSSPISKVVSIKLDLLTQTQASKSY